MLLTSCNGEIITDPHIPTEYNPEKAGVDVINTIDLSSMISSSNSDIHFAKDNHHFYFLIDDLVTKINETSMTIDSSLDIDYLDDLSVDINLYTNTTVIDLAVHDDKILIVYVFFNYQDGTVSDYLTRCLSLNIDGTNRNILEIEPAITYGAIGYNNGNDLVWISGNFNDYSGFKTYHYDATNDTYTFNSQFAGLNNNHIAFEGNYIWFTDYIRANDELNLHQVPYNNTSSKENSIKINYLNLYHYEFEDFLINGENVLILYKKNNKYGLYEVTPL